MVVVGGNRYRRCGSFGRLSLRNLLAIDVNLYIVMGFHSLGAPNLHHGSSMSKGSGTP